MRSVDIVASNNDHRELETLLVRVNQHFCRSFACSVWICGGQNASFQQILIIVFNFTIHLISGDVDEFLDSDLLRALQENVCAVDVCVCEGIRVTKTQINMRLCSEVENGIDVVALEAVHNFGGVCDVAMVEREVSLVVEDSGIVERGTVVELVEGDDIVCIRVGKGKMSYQPASTATVRDMRYWSCSIAHMKPAPPVIMIFLTSGKGSNFVVPVKTGASFHTPKSVKNFAAPAFAFAGVGKSS